MASSTGATEFIDSTTADQMIPEVWSPKMIVSREAAFNYARTVDLSYKPLLRMGDILNVPNVSSMTAQTKTKSSNAATQYETLTDTVTQITVATWGYSALAVEEIVDVQAIADQAAVYAPKQGAALSKQVDDTLAGHPDDFSNFVGTLASNLTFTNILRSIQYLDDADVDEEGRVIHVSPAEAVGLLQMKEYVHNDYSMLHGSGPATSAHERGYVTSFLGVPIYKSTNVEGTNAAGHDNTIFQKEAIALILQKEPSSWTLKDPDFFVRKIAFSQIYGSAMMRNDHGVWVKGA